MKIKYFKYKRKEDIIIYFLFKVIRNYKDPKDILYFREDPFLLISSKKTDKISKQILLDFDKYRKFLFPILQDKFLFKIINEKDIISGGNWTMVSLKTEKEEYDDLWNKIYKKNNIQNSYHIGNIEKIKRRFKREFDIYGQNSIPKIKEVYLKKISRIIFSSFSDVDFGIFISFLNMDEFNYKNIESEDDLLEFLKYLSYSRNKKNQTILIDLINNFFKASYKNISKFDMEFLEKIYKEVFDKKIFFKEDLESITVVEANNDKEFFIILNNKYSKEEFILSLPINSKQWSLLYQIAQIKDNEINTIRNGDRKTIDNINLKTSKIFSKTRINHKNFLYEENGVVKSKIKIEFITNRNFNLRKNKELKNLKS